MPPGDATIDRVVVRHMYFPGQKNSNNILKAALKVEIRREASAILNNEISAFFGNLNTRRIVVELINCSRDDLVNTIRWCAFGSALAELP